MGFGIAGLRDVFLFGLRVVFLFGLRVVFFYLGYEFFKWGYELFYCGLEGDGLVHVFVGFYLFVEGQGVGTRGGGEAPEAEV